MLRSRTATNAIPTPRPYFRPRLTIHFTSFRKIPFMERETRFELVPSAWKAVMLAVNTIPALRKLFKRIQTVCLTSVHMQQSVTYFSSYWASSGLLDISRRDQSNCLYTKMASLLNSFLNAYALSVIYLDHRNNIISNLIQTIKFNFLNLVLVVGIEPTWITV